MPAVFICYRREQSGGHAGRLYDRFRQEFGDDNVFMDVAIEPGVNFKKQIEQAVGASSVLVSVIGAQWTTDQLANARDWVMDFSQTDGDKLDVSGIDAKNTNLFVNDAFLFIGSSEFTTVM